MYHWIIYGLYDISLKWVFKNLLTNIYYLFDVQMQ